MNRFDKLIRGWPTPYHWALWEYREGGVTLTWYDLASDVIDGCEWANCKSNMRKIEENIRESYGY